MIWDFTHDTGGNSLLKNSHASHEVVRQSNAGLISVVLDLSGEWFGGLGSVNFGCLQKAYHMPFWRRYPGSQTLLQLK